MRTRWVPLALLLVAGCGSDAVSVPRPDVPDVIEVTSAAFGDGRRIPRDHTCEGQGRFPPLVWDGFLGGAVSAAVVVTDPDAPDGVFVHRVVYGLPPGSGGLAGSDLPDGAREADNSGGDPGWYPPCPPSGTHTATSSPSTPVTARKSHLGDQLVRGRGNYP